jgi:hypothetical protein
MKMPDALRAEGVDECALAVTYKSLLKRVKATEQTVDAKLLLETARDCVKILEPSRASPPGDGNFQLVHFIPRPNRDDIP